MKLSFLSGFYKYLPRHNSAIKQDLLFAIAATLFAVVVGSLGSISISYGLLAAFSITLVIIVLVKPIFLAYMIIAGIAMTSGMQRGALIPYLIPNEVILFFSVVFSLPYIMIKQFRVNKMSLSINVSILFLVLGIVVIPLFSYYFRGISLAKGEIIRLCSPVQYVFLYILFLYLPANDNQVKGLVRFMWICAAMVAIIGLLQAGHYSPVILLLNEWYPSSHTSASAQAERVTSLLGVWNGLGTFLMINLLSLRVFQGSLREWWEKGIAICVLVFCAACLVATSSYAGLIGFLVGILIIAYFYRGGMKEIIAMLLVLGLAAIPLQSNILTRFHYQFGSGDLLPHTFQFRIYVWKDIFWPVVQKNFLWGYRPTISDLAWAYAESNYFSLLLSGGIFALLAHILWIILSLGWLYKLTRSGNFLVRNLAISIFTWLIVLSLMAITNEVFTFSGTADYLWIMLGLLAGRESHKL